MIANFASNEFLVGLLSFLFTILVLSYIVGDNPAFRLAVHVFVGVAAGYVTAVVIQQVIVNRLFVPLVFGNTGDRLALIVPLLMSLLLLTKMSTQLEALGRPVVAFLVGVGAAAVIAGALMGTLFPQVGASTAMFSLGGRGDFVQSVGGLIAAAFVLLGTVVTLAYFQFTIRKAAAGKPRGKIAAFVAMLGQIFISITLGTIFAGVLAAALTAFVDRIHSLVMFLDSFIK